MFKRLGGLAAALCLIADPACAQSTKAELLGAVRDSAALPVQQAAVEITNAATGYTIRTETGEDGVYRFLALPAGEYALAVGKPGFAPVARAGVLLRVGDHLTLDFDLRAGDASERIEVTAAAPVLETNRGSASFTADQKKIVNLPLDGRNFVPLIALAPGVNLPPGNLLPRINGSRPRVSEYIYDGISVLQPEPGQVAFYPIIDAIEEFRVETNSYSAEYGRSNGGVIMVNQKAGTNQLHATLFEFFRNELLNARNRFATAGPAPRFRRNQFGLTAGGPIQKDKWFFFGDWQATRLNTGVVRTSTVPTSAQHQGAFSAAIYDPATTRQVNGQSVRDAFPANLIPAARLDRAALTVVGRYPFPNVFTPAGAEAAANNYIRLANDDTRASQFDGRLDRYFGAAHRVFARYSYLRDDTRPSTPLPDGSGNLTTAFIGNTLTRADSTVAEHAWTLSPSAVNQFRFGYTRRGFDRGAARTGLPVAQSTGIPNIPVSAFADALPIFDIVGLQQLGPPASANSQFNTSVMQWIDTFSWVRGGHSLKAGADVRRETLAVLQPPSPTGNFQFTNIFTAALNPAGSVIANTGNSFASFLIGQVTRFSLDAQPEALQPRAKIAEFFLQDDWRVNGRLALNLGVRYTLNFPSTIVGDRGSVFNLNTQTLDYFGVNGFPHTARNLEKTNFGPRAGLAFKLTNSLVLRSGYGLTWIEQAGITTPFTTPLFPFIQTLGEQTLDNLHPAFVLSQGPAVQPQGPTPDAGLGQGVFGVQRDNGSGYAQQWNLTLQKAVGADWSVEAGYFGSKLTRLGVPDVNLNQLTTAQLALGAALTAQVPNPYYGQIPANTSLGTPTIARGQLLRPYPRFTAVSLYRNNIGHSTYHALQTHVERRFSRGLTFTAAYTFSRLIDDAGAVFDSAVLTGPVTNFQAADSFNKRLEKDVSTGNIPHIVAVGFVYQVPAPRRWARLAGGWKAGGIARIQSGSPIAVTQATNLNAFAGFGIQRPNRLFDPTLPAGQRTTARWFNIAAFAAAPQFTIGNSSRNPVAGPGYRTLDVMAGKSFPIAERVAAEFRAEAFNVTNTPPLGSPNASFGNAAFGTITTALDPRVFELVLKVLF